MNITLGENCPDCGVTMGEFHSTSCDVDHCRECGGQLLGICCDDQVGPNIWTGIWPGELECAMYNLYSKFVGMGTPTAHWESAKADDPEANPDLNTLFTKYRWNKGQQLWVKK